MSVLEEKEMTQEEFNEWVVQTLEKMSDILGRLAAQVGQSSNLMGGLGAALASMGDDIEEIEVEPEEPATTVSV